MYNFKFHWKHKASANTLSAVFAISNSSASIALCLLNAAALFPEILAIEVGCWTTQILVMEQQHLNALFRERMAIVGTAENLVNLIMPHI